jgi:hypothetical protein
MGKGCSMNLSNLFIWRAIYGLEPKSGGERNKLKMSVDDRMGQCH